MSEIPLKRPVSICWNNLAGDRTNKKAEALAMMAACFTRESDGLASAFKTHRTASESYRVFVEPVTWLDGPNREMSTMRTSSTERWLDVNRRALARFQPA